MRVKHLLFIAVPLLVVAASFIYLRVNPVGVFLSFPSFFAFLRYNFFPPNFDGFRGHVPVIFQTVLFAVAGTYISAVLAFFLGILMSREMNRFVILRGCVRFFVSFLRNVPLLIWASLLVFIFGIGPLIGVLALVLATLGFLARSYAESIDEIAGSRLEALRASGAGYFQILFHGLVPEFVPSWINWTLFSFEINIRASAVLGMVGAGGLGLLIQTNLDLRGFRRAAALIIILVVMVLAVEFIVNIVRKWVKEKSPGLTMAIMLTFLFAVSVYFLNLDIGRFVSRFGNARRVLSLLMSFNPSALPDIFYHLFISIALGICGLFLGFIISFMLAFLAADNIAPIRPLSWIIKGFVSVIRAIPSLVLILMVVASLGFGFTTAVVGLVFSSVGYLTKAFIASIEEQDYAVIEAKRASGAGWIQIVFHGLLSGVWNAFISWLSIRLEGNISDSISLGIVGAGGVGMLISRAVRQHNFPNITTTIVVIFAVMLLIELGSVKLRELLRPSR